MRVALLRGPNELVVEETDVPQPGLGEMLVRIPRVRHLRQRFNGLVRGAKGAVRFRPRTDRRCRRGRAGRHGRFKPGDRVVLHHHAPCMECEVCRRGDVVHCPVWRRQALLPGGMAEFALVAEQSVRHDTLTLPENMAYEAGTLVEPLACVVKALNRAGFEPGMRVLVIGLGFTGQLFGFLAKSRGAKSDGGLRLGSQSLGPRRRALGRRGVRCRSTNSARACI